jgi:hypothetical protein
VRPHPETRGTGPRILGIHARNDSARPAVPGDDIEWPGDLAVILLAARLVARWDAFSDRSAAEWPRRSGLGNRRRQWSALSMIPDRRPTARSHPNTGWVLWTADASSKATTTSVGAGQCLCGAPRRNRTGDPSLPWNHREPLCGPPLPQVTLDRRGQSYGFSFGEGMRSLSGHALGGSPGIPTSASDCVRILP